MPELSTKPYLIRAIYEWCADSGFTPYLSVKVDQNTRVPLEYVKNGEIVLSVSQQATRNLTIGNDLVQFSARFNGVSREIAVPIYAIQSIFARENGRGVFFDPEPAPESAVGAQGVPTLQAVPTSPQGAAAAPSTTPSVPPQLTSVTTTPAAAEPDRDDEQPPPDKPRPQPRGNLRIIK